MPAVQKSFKIRAYPNGWQIRQLNHWFGVSRFVWNHAMEMRSKAYQRRKESVTSAGISQHLTKLKKLPSFNWLKEPPATCLVQTLLDQDKAFANFFRRVKARENPGYPQFRSRHDNCVSLRFQDASPSKWIKGIVSLTKLGAIKLSEPLPDVPCPKMVTLKREADGRYYISFSTSVDIELLPVTGQVIGIDLGLTHLATLSSGEKIENPRKLQKRLRYLRQQQRCLSRRQRGSKRYQKQRIRVARAHTKIKNQRSNYAHNLTTRLVRENDVICIEDLKVKNMIKHPRLAKHIADASWGEIRRQLDYKCRWYGRTLVVVDQWFPSSKTCSKCSHKVDEMRLDVRKWYCPKCGTAHDRDINAAQNIVAAGMLQLGGGEHRDLLVDGAAVNAPREARTGQMANVI